MKKKYIYINCLQINVLDNKLLVNNLRRTLATFRGKNSSGYEQYFKELLRGERWETLG